MTTSTLELPAVQTGTLADLLHELGDIPLERVRRTPPPGTATEEDAVRAAAAGHLCELIDGTLVEKAMGMPQSALTWLLIHAMSDFILDHDLGMVTTPDAMFRMLGNNIRLPDLGFTRMDRLPNPMPQVGGWCPDLCVEVISPGNTVAEMALKRAEYFASGCRLVWEFDTDDRTVTVYTPAGDSDVVAETGTLDGGAVLPGLAISMPELWAKYARFVRATP